MPVYMQVKGIKGSVTEDKHKEWIKVDSYNYAMARDIRMDVGNIKDRVSGSPALSFIQISKFVDESTIELVKWFYKADPREVKLDLTREDGTAVMSITLTNALLSNYNLSGAETSFHEALSLGYTKIETRYVPHGDENKPGAGSSTVFDLVSAKNT